LSEKLSLSKKIFLKSMGFGAGFALILCAVVAGFLYYGSRPKPAKPWNRDAIIAKSSGLSIGCHESLVFYYNYIVENTTDSDYYFPKDNKSAFIILPENKGLSQDKSFEWDSGAYIPSKQKIEVSFRMSHEYTESFQKEDCLNNTKKLTAFALRRLGEMDGFVIFDSFLRYQIDFPETWEEEMKKGEKTAGE
jgi:hypothetical protein